MKPLIARQKWLMAALAATALLTTPMWANATTTHYVAHLTTLNQSGVTGSANLWFNNSNNMLEVQINAKGLMPNIAHAQHIHGMFDANGNPTNSTTPTLAQDTNHDGYIELGEGQKSYGPILIPLSTSPGSGVFPVTAANGTLNYTETFDLTNPLTYQSKLARKGTTEADLFPLTFREIVLHGEDAPVAINNDALGLSFAKGQYDPVFPLASGEIVSAVPEPADLGMMLGGLGLIFGFLWLRRRNSLRHEDA